MNVISAMSLEGTVRPMLTSLEFSEFSEFSDDKSIHPAQVAFAPSVELSCEDCNPIWENGLAA